MKQIFYCIIVLSTFVLTMTSCEDEPTLFEEKDALYFGTTDTLISYSFAKYPKKTNDTLFVPVKVLGNTASSDRNFEVEAIVSAGENPGVEGEHFKLGGNAVIPANATAGTLPVIVYRTEEMAAGQVISFALRLKKSADFPAEGISLNQKLAIQVAYMQMPPNWGEFTGVITGYFAGYRDNFGSWSPTKYKVILDALYNEETGETVAEFPVSRFSPPIIYNQYVAVVRNYIKKNYPGNYGLPGAVLTDPDNSNLPIQVGPANY